MSEFAAEYAFYVLFVGVFQVLWAAIVAAMILPLIPRFTQRTYGSLLRNFALLNVFLLVWGGFGNAVWLHLTVERLLVADDCPVWAPFVPFGRWVLDRAAGWPGGWELQGGTTVRELQFLWAVVAVPVWVASFLSVSASRGLFAHFCHRSHATSVS